MFNQDLDSFVRLSKFAGERFDLTQAGGGNSSVKLNDGTMLIKASGFLLSEVTEEKGYSKLDNEALKNIFSSFSPESIKDKRQRESYSKELVEKATITGYPRPSIETLLHSLLQKFVLHTHPVLVNAITCRSNWQSILSLLFPEAVFVSYKTPGVDLALMLKQELNKNTDLPKIVFLQNHGIIVSSDDAEEIIEIYSSVISVLSEFLKTDLSYYSLTNKISVLINKAVGPYKISFMSEDLQLSRILEKKRALLSSPVFCPDTFVFCGYGIVEISDINSKEEIISYTSKFREDPKVVVYRNHIFFIAENLKKAREMEEVFKFHLIASENAAGNIIPLSGEELKYLGNWEAEKYRQKL
ncbi:MAG: class II aldolase/adducin family protein [Cytophagaceae bacterium]